MKKCDQIKIPTFPKTEVRRERWFHRDWIQIPRSRNQSLSSAHQLPVNDVSSSETSLEALFLLQLLPIIIFPVFQPPIEALRSTRSHEMVKALVVLLQTHQSVSAGSVWPEEEEKREKLVSRCQLLCFPAWISYQRGLIWIKCLKAFQTPADLNSFWLDLQTKQTVMMQACVKMSPAAAQQTPAIDVFINAASEKIKTWMKTQHIWHLRSGNATFV